VERNELLVFTLTVMMVAMRCHASFGMTPDPTPSTPSVDKNVRATFNTYTITVSKTKMVWSFNGMTIHSVDGKWTEPMTTRLIMRTNFRNGDPGVMPDHVFEINEYSFTPTLEVRL
jgi:hypothetical protein